MSVYGRIRLAIPKSSKLYGKISVWAHTIEYCLIMRTNPYACVNENPDPPPPRDKVGVRRG